MLTVDQVAEKLNVHRNTVINLIKQGKIRAIRIGDQYRIPEETYSQFITASEVRPDNVVAGSKVLG
ncbi:MAG: hypothetical protein FD167_2946 [bacterium]|nr:MAG: hypothetical protein FD167_2946 [bacterium]